MKQHTGNAQAGRTLPKGITRVTVNGWQEEGQCDGCGNPILVGDRMYLKDDGYQGYYCCLACAVHGVNIYPER